MSGPRKGDIEDVKREVALLLASAVFITALALVDAEKGGTRATPTPPDGAVHEFEKRTKSAVGYPVAEVIGHRTVYGTTDQQTKTAVHEIDVVWTQVGDDEETITRDLERLVRATCNLFWPALGPISLPGFPTEPIVIVSEEFTELMPATDHPFVKGAATRMLITTERL